MASNITMNKTGKNNFKHNFKYSKTNLNFFLMNNESFYLVIRLFCLSGSWRLDFTLKLRLIESNIINMSQWWQLSRIITCPCNNAFRLPESAMNSYNSPSFRYLLLCGEEMVGDSILTACSLKLRLLGQGNIHFLLTYASSSCLENKSTEHVSGLLEDSLARWSFYSIPWPHPQLELEVRRKMLFTSL